ncbi:MAG: flavodoxin domain-containing protein [Candidatus Omnitrophota bacterium]
MPKIEIKKDIFWVGAIDWNVRNFHGHTYSTRRGTTYNAYLIIDKKTTLIDTVWGPYAQEMLENIRQVIPLEKIDYIIANHVETDHSGALPEVMKACPRAKVLGTQKCKEGLYRYYYGDWDFKIVKSRDTLELGRHTLSFLEAPMIHWPDSMFTYCLQEKLLMPNDAFGQHYATSARFDDEVDVSALMDEAAKYYGNILWPLSSLILKKIEEVQKSDIPIDMIAPSHGVIWRKDPQKIINAYLGWARNATIPKAVIVYETMWGSTEKMARMIAQGLMDKGKEVKLFDIALSERTEVIKEMLDAEVFIFGSSTHNNDMLVNMAAFLEFLKGLRPKKRKAWVFGSYGWAGGALRGMEDIINKSGIDFMQPSISVRYNPDAGELRQCYALGEKIAQAL